MATMAQNEIDAKEKANSLETQSAAQNEDHNWEPFLADDPRPLLPAGEYQVLCMRAMHRS
jgi:hypothetical protein